MASFQTTVSIVALITLIVIFITIAISLHIAKKKETWPPILSQCPDYWVDESNNGSKCVNIQNLGTCKPTNQAHQSMDFTSPIFMGSNGICEKYRWAKGCDLTWDGITYGVPNPCTPKKTMNT